MARATAKDVAKEAAVDPSTVSRVLNRPSVSHRYDSATIERIREAAQRLGYVPSRTAQALRTGKTLLLGLLVSDIANPFFAELAARIERAARGRGYRLVVCNTDELPMQQEELLHELISRGVDGLIVSPSGVGGLRQVVEAGVPLVTIDRRVRGLRVPHVGLDDVQAGRLLGEHLRILGYTRVGVVAPACDYDSSIDLRLRGLRKGLGRRDAVVWVAQWPHPGNPGQAASVVRRQLQAVAPQVVVGLNLPSNLAALEALGQLPLDVPQQVGVAGIDDFAAASLVRPAITVAAQPIDAIAEQALAMLFESRTDAEAKRVHLLPPILNKRASLRCLLD